VGDRVRISARHAPGHVRTPFYVRGAVGHIERILTEFLDPEREAFGINAGTETPLYRVRLDQRTLWPDDSGEPADVLELEICEHWLEPAPAPSHQENPS
jgi:hypothetical protein